MWPIIAVCNLKVWGTSWAFTHWTCTARPRCWLLTAEGLRQTYWKASHNHEADCPGTDARKNHTFHRLFFKPNHLKFLIRKWHIISSCMRLPVINLTYLAPSNIREKSAKPISPPAASLPVSFGDLLHFFSDGTLSVQGKRGRNNVKWRKRGSLPWRRLFRFAGALLPGPIRTWLRSSLPYERKAPLWRIHPDSARGGETRPDNCSEG